MRYYFKDIRLVTPVRKFAREAGIREAEGASRMVYLARLADAIHVLHCFQKKSQQTAKEDIELAQKCYRHLMQEQDQ